MKGERELCLELKMEKKLSPVIRVLMEIGTLEVTNLRLRS